MRMAEFYGQNLTAEQLSEQEKVPRSIYENFVHNQKCSTCGEEPCHLEKKNNSGHSLSVSSSDNEARKKELEKKIIEAKRQRKSTQEIERLQSELQKLSNDQQCKEEIKPAKNNNLLISGVIIFLVSTLILGVILVNKTAKSKKNN